MNRARILLIGTAIATFAASGAYAQTTAQPQPMQPQTMQPQTMQPMQAAPGAAATGQMPVQAQQPVTPAQQNLVAPAPTDPLVQRRNANAQANAEYSASKKASKAELAAQNKQAKAQYKEEVKNAKINRKADKDAAKAELNATEPNGPKDAGLQH